MTKPEDIFDELRREGEAAIDRYVARRLAETYTLEFKQTRHEKDPAKKKDDLANLARAVSGFGNSGGGVVVWGVDCSKIDGIDGTNGKDPIPDPEKFRTWLDESTPRVTEPPHSTVEHVVIPSATPGHGFVATFVPDYIHSPLMVRNDLDIKEAGRFFVRSVNSTVPVPYAVLAGMFGRRPSPELEVSIGISELMWSPLGLIGFDLGFRVANVGRVLAVDCFLTVRVDSCRVCTDQPAHQYQSTVNKPFLDVPVFEDGAGGPWCYTAIAESTYRHPPGSRLVTQRIRFYFQKHEPTHDFRLEIVYGCDGIMPESREVVLPLSDHLRLRSLAADGPGNAAVRGELLSLLQPKRRSQ